MIHPLLAVALAAPVQAAAAAPHRTPGDGARLAAYRKLQREERYEASRHDQALRAAEMPRWRIISRSIRARPDKRTF